MNGSSRVHRVVRWAMLVATAGVMPAFVMRCDKAALNFQEGLFEGLGLSVSQTLLESGLAGIVGG